MTYPHSVKVDLKHVIYLQAKNKVVPGGDRCPEVEGVLSGSLQFHRVCGFM